MISGLASFATIRPVEDHPCCHGLAQLGKAMRDASSNKQKITRGKWHTFVAHLKNAGAIKNDIGFVLTVRGLKIGFYRFIRFNFEGAMLEQDSKFLRRVI